MTAAKVQKKEITEASSSILWLSENPGTFVNVTLLAFCFPASFSVSHLSKFSAAHHFLHKGECTSAVTELTSPQSPWY